MKSVTENLDNIEEVREIMETSFPKNEMIPFSVLLAAAKLPDFNYYAFYEDDAFCGILYTCENEKYVYMYYFAVNSKIRSRGYGSRIIEWLKNHTDKVVIGSVETPDPEAPNAEQRLRRIAFYEKNGFAVSDIKLFINGGDYLLISTDKNRLTSEEFSEFYHSKEVVIKPLVAAAM